MSLIPGDVGRPIAYLRSVVSARDIEQVASEAIATVAKRELRVRCIDGSWYMTRLFPYVTADHVIRGLVVELVKTTPLAATTLAGDIPLLSQQVLSTFPQPLVLLDAQLRILWANKAFFETFAISPSALGEPFDQAWGSKSEPPELRAFP